MVKADTTQKEGDKNNNFKIMHVIDVEAKIILYYDSLYVKLSLETGSFTVL